MRSDAEIQRAVIAELGWDPQVEETEVGVEVDRGVVTLTGTVSSYAKRLAAQQAAHRVYGVHDVANDIVVKLPGGLVRTDTEIAQAVRRALEWDVLIPDERITTTVADGWVTLTGTLEFAYQRDDAARAIRNLTGVKGLINNLILAGPPVDSDDVREEIEAALVRRAEREAGRINVAVDDGTVTLAGAVRSWPEKLAVVGAARHTPGVHDLIDEIRIDPTV
jgi:osmotically-inducible protein OsmY